MISVVLINDINDENVPTLKQFQHWVDETLSKVPSEKIPQSCTEVCISIIDPENSAMLNQTFRQKNGPTNVLSFVYESIPGVSQESLGDIAICAEIVESEALKQQKKSTAHWAHLTAHGVLHLLGYDHIAEDEAILMESLEIKILQQLAFENPYE